MDQRPTKLKNSTKKLKLTDTNVNCRKSLTVHNRNSNFDPCCGAVDVQHHHHPPQFGAVPVNGSDHNHSCFVRN